MSQNKQELKAERSRFVKVIVDVVAGTMAGINVTLVGHPFDTLKVRLQTQPHDKPIYNGLIDCFQKTIKWEGIGGLYKGVSSPIIGQMFFRALLFLSYGESKRYFSNDNKTPLKNYHYFICGGIGWGFGTFAECPIDFYKTQTQIQIIKSKTIEGYVAEYKNPIDCFRKVVAMNGYLGSYQGFLAHLMRNVPAGAVHLGLFEMSRNYFAKKQGIAVKDLSLWKSFVAGGIGGWFYWFLFYPFDVVKSAIMSDHPDKSKRRFSSIPQVYKTLLEEGGVKRFYRGFSACMLRALPANAVLLLTSSWLSEHL